VCSSWKQRSALKYLRGYLTVCKSILFLIYTSLRSLILLYSIWARIATTAHVCLNAKHPLPTRCPSHVTGGGNSIFTRLSFHGSHRWSENVGMHLTMSGGPRQVIFSCRDTALLVAPAPE